MISFFGDFSNISFAETTIFPAKTAKKVQKLQSGTASPDTLGKPLSRLVGIALLFLEIRASGRALIGAQHVTTSF